MSTTSTTAVALLRAELAPGDVVLVKASRSAGLERVAAGSAGGDPDEVGPYRGHDGARHQFARHARSRSGSSAGRGYGQEIREDGPSSHAIKRGTPTMGGSVIIVATLVGYAVAHLFVADQPGRGPTASALLVLALMTALGLVGFLDDFIKIRKQRSLGLTAAAKFFGQLLAGVGFAFGALQFKNRHGLTPASTHLSFVRDYEGIALGTAGFIVLAYLIVTATSNAVNLTDGLDGLASGTSVMVLASYVVIAFWQFGNACTRLSVVQTSCYNTRDPLDVALVAASAMGACFGFLWWNASPAKIFMGDTGSLALGGLLAGIAIVTQHRVAAGHPRRTVRDRDGVGDPAGGCLQADPQAGLQHGADPPPF